MNLSRALIASIIFSFAATPVVAQFIETPTDPPPSAKNLALPIVIEMISMRPVVDEANGDGSEGFIKNEAAAIALGKAFYWDMQVGSAGVACATCHYHAGADARDTNQLSPGIKGGDGFFNPTVSGGGGANYTLNTADFPTVSDDVVSSQGTFAATFNDVIPGAPGKDGRADDDCTIVSPDPFGFHLNNINVRRVEPRNTPTVINAAFNHRNFWDGRANNIFNGVDPFGQRNAGARVLENQGGGVAQIQVEFENSSIASQSVGPPSSDFEMACGENLMTMASRNFLKIGKKMVSAEALAGQRVHPGDSVLGSMSAHPKDGLDGPGNSGIPYSDLIEAAISNRFWDSDKLFDIDKNELVQTGTPSNTDEYTQMEANFSLIWGLAIQSYIRTLVSDDAPYDQWAEASDDRSPTVGNTKGILTEQQMRGMNLFFTNELVTGPGPKTGLRGNCSTCHQGPFFSTATFPFTEEEESGEFPEKEQLVERMRRGDGVNIAEDLFRYFISGQGQIGPFMVSGTAGARELPNIYRATVGGDITLNGVPCTVESFLMNQDRTAPFPEDVTPTREPPESRGEAPYANYSTKDAVFRVTGCGGLFDGPQGLEITINDNDGGPDTATIKSVIFGGSYAPFPSGDPIRPVYAFTVADNVTVGGDFTLEIPTVYDTAFYNIGVRPTSEDPGVGAVDPFGVPLSITKQWINQLLQIPGGAADIRALRSLNFGRVTEPFNWFGDSVWFPGGMAGYAWMTHDYVTNPLYPGAACFDGFGGPPVQPPPPDQATCEALNPNYRWIVQAKFNLAPQVGDWFLGRNGGRGDDAIPAYVPPGPGCLPPFCFPNIANYQAILDMPTAVDGAFKVPNLRNVTLTAPFFHNGGQLTLTQVVEFYNRGSDFATENLGDLAPNIHPLGLDTGQIDDIVAFLDALTDERVTCEQAPFDHPEIRIANGARGQGGSVTPDKQNPGQSKDQLELIQAVGAGGRPANFAPCIDQENFLQ